MRAARTKSFRSGSPLPGAAARSAADEIDTEDLLQRLFRLSLLLKLDLAERNARLHDVVRPWLRREIGPVQVAELNGALVAGYRARCGGAWHAVPGPAMATRRRGDSGPGRGHMPTGTVKWFNATKGYGFIQPEDGSRDVFVHISDVERSGMDNLREGQRVAFEVHEDPKSHKSSATNLRPA